MTNLETVFLNRVEVAQDQAADLEDQIPAELEDQVTVVNQIPADLEDQIPAELEDQVTVVNQIPADLEDQATTQKINQIIKKQAQSQKLAGKRIKPF